MSTNYYLKYNACKCCNRYDSIHIGKYSMGWDFLFQEISDFDLKNVDHVYKIANEEKLITLDSWKNLKDFLNIYVVELKTAEILDEYDSTIEYNEFVEMVEKTHLKDVKNHHSYCLKNRNFFDEIYSYNDEEGYSFSRREFS